MRRAGVLLPWVFGVAALSSAAAGATPPTSGPLHDPAARQLPRRAHPERESPATPVKPDLTGRARVGVASFYAREFDGRAMADGVPMNPRGNNAASKTLPLGTIAKVTNLETGKSAVVRIQDRGPYIKGRIVDLSPHTAQHIGITPRQGIAPVVVAPIRVPLPDGRVKLGAAAARPRSAVRIVGDVTPEGSAQR